ncbi:MAG: c-type cytochrome [Pirellulales bacterium]
MNCKKRHFLLALSAAAVIATIGCEPARSPQFVFDQSLVKQAQLEVAASRDLAEKASTTERAEHEKIVTAKEEFLQNVVPQRQQDITNVLTALFGTPDLDLPPAQMKTLDGIWQSMGLDSTKIKLAAGPSYSDQEGYAAGLYRRHCVHCHGVSGDGAGPTAMFLNPYPRDFRHGDFKFKSTPLGDKPTDQDLRRTLIQGIPGTAMPSFKLLATTEIDALIEYVKYLAIRGETEKALVAEVTSFVPGDSLVDYASLESTLTDQREALQGNDLKAFLTSLDDLVGKFKDSKSVAPLNLVADAEQLVRQADALAEQAAKAGNKTAQTALVAVKDALTATVSSFRDGMNDRVNTASVTRRKQAGEKVAIPPERPPVSESELDASIKLGRELFYGRGNCFSCHGPSAQGDGTKYVLNAEPGTTDAWPPDGPNQWINASLPPQTLRPRNLRTGVFRGGQRPMDVYRRITLGIGKLMPAAPTGKSGIQNDREYWALVDYVRTLQYELTPANGDGRRAVAHVASE